MRIDDVVVGEEYAWALRKWERCRRVKVVGIVKSLDYWGHRGVEIEFLGGDRYRGRLRQEPGEREKIRCIELRSTWKEYKEKHKEELETDAKREKAYNALYLEGVRVGKALVDAGFEKSGVRVHNWGTPYLHIGIYDPEQAALLSDILEEHNERR